MMRIALQVDIAIAKPVFEASLTHSVLILLLEACRSVSHKMACRIRDCPDNSERMFLKRKSQMATNQFTGLTGRYGTILIDPPWRFANRTGKMAPEHKRLRRYPTLSFEEITALPVANHAKTQSHLYMWCPNALLLEGLQIMKAWGFTYKTNIVWYKVRKDGGRMVVALDFIFEM
jgi:hypothetical protein